MPHTTWEVRMGQVTGHASFYLGGEDGAGHRSCLTLYLGGEDGAGHRSYLTLSGR